MPPRCKPSSSASRFAPVCQSPPPSGRTVRLRAHPHRKQCDVVFHTVDVHGVNDAACELLQRLLLQRTCDRREPADRDVQVRAGSLDEAVGVDQQQVARAQVADDSGAAVGGKTQWDCWSAFDAASGRVVTDDERRDVSGVEMPKLARARVEHAVEQRHKLVDTHIGLPHQPVQPAQDAGRGGVVGYVRAYRRT